MAITVTTSPAAYNGSKNAILWQVTSDRDNAVALTSVALSDYSGTVAGTVLATKATHGLLTGDIVRVSDTSMDGDYAITKVDANTFYFTATYNATDTNGSVTRLNEQFQMKCVLEIFALGLSYTLRTLGDSGTYSFYVQGILDAVLSREPETLDTAGTPIPCSTGVQLFRAKFYEEYNDEDGLLKTGDDLTTSYYLVVPMAKQYTATAQTISEYPGNNLTPGKFLTTAPSFRMKMGDELQLSFMPDDTNASTYLHITKYPGGSTAQSTAQSLTSNLFAYPVNDNLYGTSALTHIEVRVKNQADAVISEVMTIYFDPFPCYRRIWWLNELGGYDAYNFIGIPDIMRVSESETLAKDVPAKNTYLMEKYDVDAWYQGDISSGYLTEAEAEWVGRVIQSDDVYIEEDGILVPIIVETGDIVEQGEGIKNITLSFRYSYGLK